MTDEEIVRACRPLLETIHIHEHGNHERCFVTAYQIWILLQQENNSICQTLVLEYGPAVGKGGGINVGPAQRIAQALGHSRQIETHYIDTRRLLFGSHGKVEFEASGVDCGLFRLS